MSLLDSTTILSGDIAYLRFVMTWQNEDWQRENKAWELLRETKPLLDDQIRETVRKQMGAEFSVRDVVLVRGSIEVVVIIGTVYYVTSKYKNFIESIGLLKSQLKGLIRGHVDPQSIEPITMTDTWVPGPALASSGIGARRIASDDLTKILLLSYLILSHAALLTLLIWLIVRSR